MNKRAAVIGGGLGGMTVAARLAILGLDVSLYEANNRLGGKAGYVKHEGYYFDTGPSLLTMPFVLKDLFKAAGKNIDDYLTMVPIQPICRYFWEDGTVLDASSDTQKMQDALSRISETDSAMYPEFLKYSKQIYDLTYNIFLDRPIHEWKSAANLDNLTTLLRIHKIDPFRTMDEGVQRFFSHPHIVQLFNRYATYNGSDPYKTPATLNIIPHVEYTIGGYYIMGGIYNLVTGLEQLLRELGVNIFLNTPVDEILHDRKTVKGITINGETIYTDYVISNVDVVHTYDYLVHGFPHKEKQLKCLEPSLSGMVFLWGMKRKFPELVHHNVLFSKDYRREFDELFQEKKAPEDPTIYISIPGKTDPVLDTHEKESWYVLVNMPYVTNGQTWDLWIQRIRTAVISKLKSVGIDVADSITYEHIISPPDFERMYHTNKGSIYGISSNSRASAFKRPANRSRDLEGLYFVGGSTHPGGGIPLVMLSGKIVAELIAGDIPQRKTTGITFT